MDLGNFTSHGAQGDGFLKGMMSYEEKSRAARVKFTEFIEEQGFSAWHIHDGWVRHDGKSGDILNNEYLTLSWVSQHAGYSHTLRSPNIGETMVIIKDSPSGEETEPFYIYCYQVADTILRVFEDFYLKLFDVRKVVFNKETDSYEIKVPFNLISYIKIKMSEINILFPVKRKLLELYSTYYS